MQPTEETLENIDYAATSAQRLLRDALDALSGDYLTADLGTAKTHAVRALDFVYGSFDYLFDMLKGAGVDPDLLTIEQLEDPRVLRQI